MEELIATITGYFTLAPQAGDAAVYLNIGRACALAQSCYHEYRTLAAVHWFSIPYRLGVDPGVLVLFHAILVLISIFISSCALNHLLKNLYNITSPLSMILLCALSAVAHCIFAFPFMRYSLTDLPASMLVVIAGSILLIKPKNPFFYSASLCIAGLLMGLASWMRPFFLFPVLISIAVAAFFMIKRSKKKQVVFLLCATIFPLCIQSYYVYKKNNSFGVVSSDQTLHWANAHFFNKATALESVFPWVWYPECHKNSSLGDAFIDRDIQQAFCLIRHRLNFIFGSYNGNLYIHHEKINFVSSRKRPLISHENSEIKTYNYDSFYKADDNKANKINLFLKKKDQSDISFISKKVFLDKNNFYNLGTLVECVGSPCFLDLTLSMDGQVFFEKGLFPLFKEGDTSLSGVDEKEVEVEFDNNDFLIRDSGFYEVRLSDDYHKYELEKYLEENKIVLNKGGIKIIEISLLEKAYSQPDYVRIWSPFILLANIFAVSLSVVMIIFNGYKLDFFQKTPFILATLIIIQGVVLVPEQRMLIAAMIFIWIWPCFYFARFLFAGAPKK